MKLNIILTAFTLLTLTTCIPVFYKQRDALQRTLQQHTLLDDSTSSSPEPSLKTSSTSSSSSHDSRKSRLSSVLTSFSPQPFACHSPDPSLALRDLATYLTTLIKSYRDELFDKKGASAPSFQVCLGGWGRDKTILKEAADLQPSIYFQAMTKKQLAKVEELLKRQTGKVFEGVTIKRVADGGLVVSREVDG